MSQTRVFQKYIDRLDELIEQGKTIADDSLSFEEASAMGWIEDFPETLFSAMSVEEESFIKWKTNCINLLENSLPTTESLKQTIKEISDIKNKEEYLFLYAISAKLKAIKEDLEKGILRNLAFQIEVEVAVEYMELANQLLAEGQLGRHSHVPAAVLAGAVLEKNLRTLCEKQCPAIPTVNSKNEPLTLNPLIDVLKKATVFNELKAKHLRAWADIRNAAAHGEFDKFSRSDVEGMIKGVSDFLAIHMT